LRIRKTSGLGKNYLRAHVTLFGYENKYLHTHMLWNMTGGIVIDIGMENIPAILDKSFQQ
jgi:hypothetical protein